MMRQPGPKALRLDEDLDGVSWRDVKTLKDGLVVGLFGLSFLFPQP